MVCRESYYEFFVRYWPCIEDYELADNWHIEYLCDEMQYVAERVFKRRSLQYNLAINIAPGETKSSITTVLFPVWCWIVDPTLRIITSSYSRDLAMEHTMKSRDLIRSEKFQYYFGDVFTLRKDKDAKTNYGNDKGGARMIASVGSTITGKHAHILILDDPISPDEARSEVQRETANHWCTSTLSTRKVDAKMTPTILVMQRLHEDDPTAKLTNAWEKNGELKWIRLPADDRYEINPPELVKHYEQDGELKVMNPHRKPTRVIRAMEAVMSLQEAAGQLGQDPQPFEGNKLKKEWFSQRISLTELQRMIESERGVLQWNAVLDGAYTKEKHNSATGVLIWASYKRKLYLRAYKDFFLEFPQAITQIPQWMFANGIDKSSVTYVEPKATGKSLVQTWRSMGGINVVEDKPNDGGTMLGKEARIDKISAFVQGMNVIPLEGWDWQPFIHQCAIFPNGKHTEAPDVLAMAVDKVGFSVDWADFENLL